MLDPKMTLEALQQAGIRFYCGVPDSLLKEFCSVVETRAARENHVIAANEGCAVGIAAGNHLKTGDIPLVYLQNSGLGNMVNPLVSLAAPEVYGIPMLVMIGWRGGPGVKDEPQHMKQGQATCPLLDSIGVPWEVLPKEGAEATGCIHRVLGKTVALGAPCALVVEKGTFAKAGKVEAKATGSGIGREQAIEAVSNLVPEDVPVVASTGKISRELYEVREKHGQSHAGDFLTVGSMGHGSQVALGIALADPAKQVVYLDGDGAALMHMGGLATIGNYGRHTNLKHIVLNNCAHESVGGQPTVGCGVSFPGIASACGYPFAAKVDSFVKLPQAVRALLDVRGPSFLEILVEPGSRSDLGRPAESPADSKKAFMEFLQK
jgi:phosphonopyruvate decarboxylase